MDPEQPRASISSMGVGVTRDIESPLSTRKRASKACLACRARKIRCDVASHSTPCTNCRISRGECIVRGRPAKYRTSKGNKQNTSTDIPPVRSQVPPSSPPRNLSASAGLELQRNSYTLISDDGLDHNALCQRRQSSIGGHIGQYANWRHLDQVNPQSLTPVTERPIENNPAERDKTSHENPWTERQRTNKIASLIGSDDDISQVNASHTNSHADLGADVSRISGSQTRLNSNPSHSEYHFIEFDDFSELSVEDIRFLKAQGCFQIPAMPALDRFVQQYFLHVHPLLPMIDEANFWNVFNNNSDGHGQPFKISIFTFQAMLFSCCSFVPLDTLHDVGFRNVRHARATLYRRAKALFDFDGKRDLISTSQGALLLSQAPDNHNRRINTFWLGVAIQFAKDANAPQYDLDQAITEKQRNVKKRLWWCCILRDRILPLGVRRPLFITNAHFDFGNSPLTANDLDEEISYSNVYDSETKRSLAELLEVLCNLAVCLTDIIMILYPINGNPTTSLNELGLTRLRVHIERGKADLSQWFDNASVHFPTPAGLGDTHGSVILHTNVVYIYYYSARMALCHHEILLLEMDSKSDTSYPRQLHKTKRELQEAVTFLADITKELLQLKLVRYLPVSVVPAASLLLVLHMLDVKLSSTKSQRSMRQRRLQVFLEVMNVLQSIYDSTDRVSDAIEQLIAYFGPDDLLENTRAPTLAGSWETQYSSPATFSSNSASAETSSSTINDWSDVLLRRRSCYLRIVMTLDITFSKGEFPKETDFPDPLQTSQLAAYLPLYRA
ncbi:hypothetical protein VE01_10768 [Pseudogymnoascus verrucosus]|uniref:Zn(2)-C6 fungal-type domain-containing protein n=1 Tax=Pseudogymnoascus verrucosus TaxID=342668 RepID=A0A2P6FGV1_9PEZI|nr:uncharacterized protein VE01_10768 [Pseudogymnoascus verrucosus]PQM43872.1 hypothetical protein VE01_10768 [Pseudogymnoascus verrucosus]